ncbi:hypothetical protein FO470_04990 [Starkeya sp. 3C]|uniref:Tip attachment protein J domain-containing protein n=1 Tax=Ancylobacter moscoviensis TaxID=2597768 RepID=A0ABY3DWR6_9HYPH|nr:host specificity factor TipJ family phage tail protein [Ancylobacter moscoviensis]TSJ64617.1 hypothetical protein FO470_04990 [Ancylobacter moscoviensis]
MTAVTALPVLHIALPGIELARAMSRPRETIASFLRRVGWSTTLVPTICVVDGAPVLRAAWRKTRIRRGMAVEFRSMPQGGSMSGSSIAGLLGVIALSALAPWATGVLASALSITSAIGKGLLGAAILAGGSFLLSMLPRVQSGGSQDEATPIYSWSRQTNSAKPLQPVPSAYGRTKRMLDYAAVPWSSFEGGNQFLHVLLSEGEGKFSREQILIDDTVLWNSTTGINPNFSGVTIDFYDPGQEITAFPINVETSTEVDGQELAYPAWTGGFVVNSAGSTATRLVVDIVMPSCGKTNDEGILTPHAVAVMSEYRPVDNTGNPTGDGSWSTLAFGGGAFCSKSPVRFSLTGDVPPGRYAVRARRTTPSSTDGTVQDDLTWAGLRAFITGPKAFPVSTIAIRARATDQFSGDAASQLSVVETRILPVWDGAAWVDLPTRSPAWAALDIATNADYGGRLPLTRVDFQAFVDLAALSASRGDTFDYDFTSTQPVTDALDIALATCRTKHKWLGGALSLVRDQWSSIPSMMLTDSEIVRGSMEIEYLMKPTEASQCVVLEYIDESTWSIEEAVAPRDATEEQIADATRLQLPGIGNRTQAQREAEFLLRQNLFRRRTVTLETEHDGRMLSLGSAVLLQSNLPQQWGQSGKVVRNVGLGLFLDRPATWSGGQHWISLRDARGREFGPIKCSMGLNASIAVLDSVDLAAVEVAQGLDLADVLVPSPGGALPSYALGLGTTWRQRCVVSRGSPSGDRVQLEFFVDDVRVHDEDHTAPPPLPDGSALSNQAQLVVAGLSARFIANEIPRRVEATWFPAVGAISYLARVSYDGGESWVPLPETRDPTLSAVVDPYALRLSVAAVSASGKRGQWTYIDLAQPSISNDNVRVMVDNFEVGLHQYVVRHNSDALSRVEAIEEWMAELVVEQDAQNYSDKQRWDFELRSSAERVTASYTQAITVATGPGSALAQSITNLQAQVDDFETNLSVRWVTAASLPSGAMAAYEIVAKASSAVNTSRAAVLVAAYADGAGGAYSVFEAEADLFVLTRRVNGQRVTPFVVNATGIFVSGNMYLDGSITAAKLNIGTLSAITGNMGTLTAGRILSPDGKIDFNLNDGYLDFWS